MEDIVFVLIGPVQLQGQLASGHAKVHSFQLSHRLECVLLGREAILELKVANTALLTCGHGVGRHVEELHS